MGGGSNEIEETAAQKAAAEVAKKQWDLYNNELKGFEDTFMQRVDSFNSDSNMDAVKQDTDLAYAKNFSEAKNQAATDMAAQGIDPSSAKFGETLSKMTSDQVVQQADTVNRAQTAEQDKHVAGLQDVVALGMGQKSEALAGMGDVADASLRKATQDAQDAFNKRAATQQLIGSAAGAAGSAYLRSANQIKPVAPQAPVPALSTATHGVTPNGMQVNSVKYDPLGRTW